MSVIQKTVSDTQKKPRYTIRNLITGGYNFLLTFFFDPNYVTPAVKDTIERVVEKIIDHVSPTSITNDGWYNHQGLKRPGKTRKSFMMSKPKDCGISIPTET